ncbi:pilus assembly protein PilA [Photobacterium leiognathi subsp. mandapamensis]|nr:pilus assembly protein PilA [Photobacterium leiognathi subsp. mandapamensis]
MKKQQGFTLIELMIVVAIIGVLSAIAVPAYKDYVAKSELASAMSTVKALITPAELAVQADGEISGGLATLGISAGSNTLGEITLTEADGTTPTIKFDFTSGSLSENEIRITRSDDGWTCKQNSSVDAKGCNKVENF